MHPDVKRLEDAIKRDPTLKEALSTTPGTNMDVGAALVLAVMRRAEGPVTVAPGVRLNPNKPNRRTYHDGAEQLAALVYDETEPYDLREVMKKSTSIIGHRPRCETVQATVLLGYLAANDPHGTRIALFGDEPSTHAAGLVTTLQSLEPIVSYRLQGLSTLYLPEHDEPRELKHAHFAP